MEYIILTDTEKEVLESIAKKLGLNFTDLTNIKKIESIFDKLNEFNQRLELCEKACNTLVTRLIGDEERIQYFENVISNMQNEEMGI